VLVDLTCDSDGKVDHYVSSEEDKSHLPLHELVDGEPYPIGLFLMGAYQDIMGDAHNLFGPVAEAHIYADAEEPGGYYVEKILRGITIKDMLGRVQYFPNDLNRRMSEIIRTKTEAGVLRPRAGVDLLEQFQAFFERGTYLNSGPHGGGR
jgi:arginine decarboxylase